MKKILISLLVIPSLCVQSQELNLPIGGNLSLSGNYGELRRNHYHMGLDIRTDGKINKPIYAVEDGYVSRILISPVGYGKAIYIHHPRLGLTSVYAHLHQFNDKINAWVEATQYALKINELDTLLPENLLPIKKGQFIAYSGNSGSSGGPHLHFELRDMYSEKTINPMHFYSQISDNISPVLSKILFYHADNQTIYLSASDPLKLKNQTISLNTNRIGIGVSAYDRMNGTSSKFGIYSLNIYQNDQLVYRQKFDSLDFNWQYTIKSVSDYSLPYSDVYKGFYDKCGFNLSDSGSQNGIIALNAQESQKIKVEIFDFNGNSSSSEFYLKSSSKRLDNSSKLLKCSEANTITDDKTFRISIPPYGLSEDVFPKYNLSSKLSEGEVWKAQIFSVNQAALKPYRLEYFGKFNPTLRDKLYLEVHTDKGIRTYTGQWEKDKFVFPVLKYYGWLKIKYDQTPPTIGSKPLKSGNSIYFTVQDKESDIEKYNLYIDGQWRIIYYDAKTNRLIYNILQIDKGKKVKALIEVWDAVGNKNSQTMEILF